MARKSMGATLTLEDTISIVQENDVIPSINTTNTITEVNIPMTTQADSHISTPIDLSVVEQLTANVASLDTSVNALRTSMREETKCTRCGGVDHWSNICPMDRNYKAIRWTRDNPIRKVESIRIWTLNALKTAYYEYEQWWRRRRTHTNREVRRVGKRTIDAVTERPSSNSGWSETEAKIQKETEEKKKKVPRQGNISNTLFIRSQCLTDNFTTTWGIPKWPLAFPILHQDRPQQNSFSIYTLGFERLRKFRPHTNSPKTSASPSFNEDLCVSKQITKQLTTFHVNKSTYDSLSATIITNYTNTFGWFILFDLEK